MAAELTLNVTQIGTGDVATNKSRVRIDLSITTTLGTWSHDYTTQGYIRFEGTEINLDGKWVDINTTTQLYSAEHVVEHKADGTKTLTVEAGFNMNTTYTGWSYATKVLVLTTIPRASTMSVPAFTLGTEGQISVSKAYEGFSHTIKYSFGSKSGDVCDKKTETPVSWTPPLTLANEIPKAVSGTGTLTITTYDGNTKVGDTKSYSFTASVPASVVPTITSVSVEPVNDNATLNSWKVYVKGKTKIKYTINAAGAYGSTVSSHSFSCAGQTKSGNGGTTITGTTNVISAKAGSYTPTATVGDSRPNRVSAAKNGSAITVYDYSEPTINKTSYAKRTSASSTTISVKCDATYSGVGGKNTLTLSYRTRPTGGAWGNSKPLTNGVEATATGFATSTSYEVEISAKDSVSDAKTVVFSVPTEEVTFMLKDGGKSASFGKYPEANGLDMGWPIIMNGNRVTGLPTPSADTDAVPLGYVDPRYAPSGYGLGSVTGPNDNYKLNPSADFINSVKPAGWYQVYFDNGSNYCGISGTQYGGVFSIPAMYGVREYFFMRKDFRSVLTRYMDDSAWSEWEWVNPPLELGKEYRTTERYQNKPVYVKAVNIGNLPAANSKVTVTYASGTATPIRASVVTSTKRAAPYVYYSSSLNTTREMHLFPESTAISVYATYDYSGETGVATVWYIKA